MVKKSQSLEKLGSYGTLELLDTGGKVDVWRKLSQTL